MGELHPTIERSPTKRGFATGNETVVIGIHKF